MKEPKPTETMDIEQESATTCKSLSLMDEEVMLNRKSPPCHQTMDLIDREGSQQDRNRKLVEMAQANTVIASTDEVALKEYQMKLSIHKKDDIETIVSMICLMMQME
jgi:hypothetical protein